MGSEYTIPPYVLHEVGDIQTLSQIYPQNVRDLKIPNIWTKTKGKGVVVAILDTGAPTNHPDLIAHVDLAKSRSFVIGESIWDTDIGHGTHVMGTVGALDNNYGIVGVAPEATLVAIKVLGKSGFSTQDSIQRGLEYCLSLKPDIVNMSLGSPDLNPQIHTLIKKLVDANIVVVAAAGNNSEERILYPAQFDEAIAVGSYSNTMLRDRSLFSSYGDTLDLMAPGEQIMSTYLNGQYSVMSGTSMAAPVVSGIIALLISYMRSVNKNYTVNSIRNILQTNTIDTGPRGYDKYNGWGIIDPEKVFESFAVSNQSVIPPKLKESFWTRLMRFFK